MLVRQHFSVAPWTNTLKFISLFSTVLLVGIGFVAYRKFCVFTGTPLIFGRAIISLFPAILILSLLFTVTGYVVEGDCLYIERLLWSTRISLTGLSKAWPDPNVCKGSLRIFGNGGLYSFTGIYQNKTLGRYRLFATDLARSVVLVLPQSRIVITPAAPQVFVDYLHHQFPMIETNGEDGETLSSEKDTPTRG